MSSKVLIFQSHFFNHLKKKNIGECNDRKQKQEASIPVHNVHSCAAGILVLHVKLDETGPENYYNHAEVLHCVFPFPKGKSNLNIPLLDNQS